MQNNPLDLVFLTTGVAIAENTAAASAQQTTVRIRQVETGLLRRVQIKGQRVQKFAIVERMREPLEIGSR